MRGRSSIARTLKRRATRALWHARTCRIRARARRLIARPHGLHGERPWPTNHRGRGPCRRTSRGRIRRTCPRSGGTRATGRLRRRRSGWRRHDARRRWRNLAARLQGWRLRRRLAGLLDAKADAGRHESTRGRGRSGRGRWRRGGGCCCGGCLDGRRRCCGWFLDRSRRLGHRGRFGHDLHGRRRRWCDGHWRLFDGRRRNFHDGLGRRFCLGRCGSGRRGRRRSRTNCLDQSRRRQARRRRLWRLGRRAPLRARSAGLLDDPRG